MIPRSVRSTSSVSASPVSFAPGKLHDQVVDGSYVQIGLGHLVLLSAILPPPRTFRLQVSRRSHPAGPLRLIHLG